MKNIVFKFYIIFLLFLKFKGNNTVEPPTSEYNCFLNIITKFQIEYKYSKNSTNNNNYEICSNNLDFICDTNSGSIIGAFIKVERFLPNTVKLLINDIKCFPFLNALQVKNLQIESGFIYNQFSNLNDLQLYNISGITGGINNFLPKLNNFYLDSFDLIGTTFKMSYANNINTSLVLEGGYFNVDVDLVSIKRNLKSISMYLLAYPDLTGFKFDSVSFLLSPSFNLASISNFSTINSNSVIIQHSVGGGVVNIDFYLHLNKMIKDISFTGNLNKPLSNIDLSNCNYQNIIMNNVGDNFNNQGNIPFSFSSNSKYTSLESLKIVSGNFTNINTSLPILNLILPSNKINTPISNFQGNNIYGNFYDFSYNQITSTIPKSWCFKELIINNNKMTGEIPSCFSCYFNQTTIASSIKIYDRFIGNQFTNLNITLPCTTFKPKLRIIYNTDGGDYLIVSGNDLGFNPTDWLFNNSFKIKSYTFSNQEYSFKFNTGFFNGLDYYSIRFINPNNDLFTFPLIEKPPKIESIIINALNQIEITGLFFSTYKNYQNQIIKVNDITLCYSTFEDFFKINCNTISQLSIDSTKQVLSVQTIGLLKDRVLFSIANGYLNNKLCLYNCTLLYQICDISIGQCVGDGIQHYITSIIPSNETGGKSIFNGYFTDSHLGLSITIGGLNCPIIFNSSTVLICNSPPGIGLKELIIIQNGFTLKDNNYQYQTILKKCLNDCTNSTSGICNTTNGECSCFSGYYSYDCSLYNYENTRQIPNTNITIDTNSGGTTFTNQEINFQIYFKSLLEIDFNGNIINEYSLINNWLNNNNNTNTNSNSNDKYTLTQYIQNGNCSIISIIEEIKNGNQLFDFANTSFTLKNGSIKFSISINNYQYENNLNTLKLILISSVNQQQEQENDSYYCNNKETELLSSNESNFNYIQISRNNKILEGRFINKVVSDGIPTYLSTSIINDSNYLIVSLNLPHCHSCLLDPDFSVLVSNDFKLSCTSVNLNSSHWFLPVVITVPIVAVLIIICFFIYKRSIFLKYIIYRLKRKFTTKNH